MLVRWPDKTLVVPPRYMGSVGYYALISAYGKVAVEVNAPFDKRQKAVHRCEVADTHGRVQLTVPIANPYQKATNVADGSDAPWQRPLWKDVLVSGHSPWWHNHWVTLESAFGRTPYFEFYADDFAPLFTSEWVGRPVVELDLDLHRVLCRLLQIESELSENSELSEFSEGSEVSEPSLPYYQVRQAEQGFHAGLSAVDLLFNLGPEAPLHLRRLNRLIAAK